MMQSLSRHHQAATTAVPLLTTDYQRNNRTRMYSNYSGNGESRPGPQPEDCFRGRHLPEAPVRFGNNAPPGTPAITYAQIQAFKLDRLTPYERQRYVTEFCEKTGFPDSQKVSQTINNHLKTVMMHAQKSLEPPGILKFIPLLRFKVIWAGHHQESDLARGKALPGSTPEGLAILVRGTPRQVMQFEEYLARKIDPDLAHYSIDPLDAPANIVFQETMMEYGHFPYIQELIEDLDENGMLITKAGDRIDPYTVLPNITLARQAARMTLVIREGKTILDQRKWGDRYLETSHLYQNLPSPPEPLQSDADASGKKQIEQNKERLCQSFPAMNPDEQFVIVRIFDWVNKKIPFNLRISSANREMHALYSLRDKGFLQPDPREPLKLIPSFIPESELERKD